MKPLVVLILTGTLIWAFLKLYPTGEQPVLEAGTGAGLEQRAAPSDSSGRPTEPPKAPRTEPGDDLFGGEDASNIFVDPVVAPGEGPEARRLGQLLAQERLDEARTYAAREAGSLPGWTPDAMQAFTGGLAGGDLEAARAAAKSAHAGGLTQGPALDLLRAALRSGPFPIEGGASGRGPIELGMELALHVQAGRRAVQTEDWVAAEEHYSAAILGELAAPWDTDPAVLERWSDEVNAFQRRHRWSRSGDWEHVEMEVQGGDSLISLRKRFIADHPGHPMCTGLIARSNGLDETIHPGDTLRIPLDPVEVLTDVSSRWLVYTLGGMVAFATQVGVGREGEETLEGEFEIGHKREEPPHWPRGKEMIPYGSPDNPLGTRWMGWRFPGQEKDTPYGYHGTWEPESIGEAESEGCVRMRNADVEFLFEVLPQGARTVVRS